MLALIGIGLDSKDISVKALDFIRTADTVIIDAYTSIIASRAIAFIEKDTGKKIEPKKRSYFEDDIRQTVASAKSGKLAMLVVGDPLIATTHHIILDEANKQKVKTTVIHAPSVFSAAIGESRLDIYRFGPTTTVPYWSKNYKPTSFIDVISRNMKNGQHTMVLLDINQAEGKPMGLSEALDIIGNAQKGRKGITPDKKVMVLADLGRPGQKIIYSEFSKVLKRAGETNGKTITLIIPADPNFAEKEAIENIPQ